MDNARNSASQPTGEAVPRQRRVKIVDRPVRLTIGFMLRWRPQKITRIFRDELVPELGFQIEPDCSSTWILLAPGPYLYQLLADGSAVSPMRARTLARRLLGIDDNGLLGIDDNGRSNPRLLFKDFAEEYRQRHVPTLKPSSQKSHKVQVRKLIKAFGRRRIASISRVDVIRWFSKYSTRYPGGANRALEELRAMFNRAKDWSRLPADHANPCVRSRKNKKRKVGKIISDEGLEQLGAATDAAIQRRAVDAANYVGLLAYTGCGPGEIRTLEWSHISDARIHLPDSKVGARKVPLGDPAAEILRRRKKSARSRYGIPAPFNAGKPLSEFAGARYWKRLKADTQLSADTRLYDLRHTFASSSVISGESMTMTGALLGHRKPSTTAIYTHLLDKDLLAASERISGIVAAWLGCDTEAFYEAKPLPG